MRRQLQTWFECNVMRWLRGPNSNLPIPGVRSAIGLLMHKLGHWEPHRGLGLDEIYISPHFNNTVRSRREPSLQTRLTRGVVTASPLQAANMQTVMTYSLADALISTGHVPILHRYFGSDWQKAFFYRHPSKAFACVGVRDPKQEVELAKQYLDAGALGICIETLHFDTWRGYEVLEGIMKYRPDAEVLIGNIVTYNAAKRCINAGASGLKVGWGPGSPCTSRELAMGVPQATAVASVCAAALPCDIPVCADGGIKGSFQYNVSMALGASTAMMGQFFARCIESAQGKPNNPDYPYPEDIREVKKSDDHSPHGLEIHYFGEASKTAWMRSNPGKDPNGSVFEGAGRWIPVERDLHFIHSMLNGGLQTIMANVGARTIHEFHQIVLNNELIHEATPGYHAERQTRFEKNAV